MAQNKSEDIVNIEDISKFPPIEDMYSHLADNVGSNPEIGVYCNRDIKRDATQKLAIVLTGFTCAGKDTVMNELESLGLGYHVVTATSRPRREGEPIDKYHWITVRERRPDETVEEYEESIKKEHDLIECDNHYGHIYGLPRESLLVEGAGIPVIRPDINGAITLHNELPKHGFEPISIAVVPDSWKQIYQILLEERRDSLENVKKRLGEDALSMESYKAVNYFLHNSRGSYQGMSGLERAILGMQFIIDRSQST